MSQKKSKLLKRVAKLYNKSVRQLKKFYVGLNRFDKEKAGYEYDRLILKARVN